VMPIFRYIVVVGSALTVLLLLSDAIFGEVETRFNGSFYQSATYAPRLPDPEASREVQFTRDVTPAARIKDVFAQFVANDSRRGRRTSSI
jgi:hypothetical protein